MGGVVPRPSLFERLGPAARVTVVSAPAGSGKTVLLRSWIAEAGLAGRAAWVAAGHGERDPQRFWLSVLGALRQTGPGAGLVRAVSPAPELDGWALAEGLLSDLAALDERLWLVIDDVHELDQDALRQLELLIMRAPPQLRFALAARHDVRLGLHRLRLDGGLTEIRARDLKFTLAEAGALFTAAGVELDEPTLALLHERTEGWAAGLRLAALSLAGHPDPERFAAGFSGTERTVAEYLLAEVLDRQPAAVRRLLLRTSILDRVNGELADLLTGDQGGERMLQDLEAAGAFVVSLDAHRSWFRYHQMFAALLRLELRRAEPGAVTGLHAAATGWLAARGLAVEAVRHAQAAEDWELAARLMAGHWPTLYLDGQAATVHELLAGFPAATRAADAGLAVVAAADELAQGSLEEAERYLMLGDGRSAPVAEGRRWQHQVLLGIVRLLHARQRGDPQAVTEEAQRLQAAAEAPDAVLTPLGDDLRVLALINLGCSEVLAIGFDAARRHLEQGVALARQVRRPFLELTGLAYLALAELVRTPAQTAAAEGQLVRVNELARQAIGLAERQGWTGEPAYGIACRAVGSVLAWQARPEEAEPWIRLAERNVTAETEPAAAVGICFARGTVELARGLDREALAAHRAAEQLAGRLTRSNLIILNARAAQLLILARLGETKRAEQLLVALEEQERDRADVRLVTAGLRLAQGDPRAATTELAPVLDGSASVLPAIWLAGAFLLEATARDALSDQDAARRALERALDLAERDGALLWFLLCPVRSLLERQARDGTMHSALVAGILDLLAGTRPTPAPEGPRPPDEPLSKTELRVLRYLPTHLSAPEMARELFVSPNTVRTHIKSLYAKLGTHHRAETVELARALGLLAPSRTGRATARPE